MAPSPRSNRGPGAATENRAALIAAAREIFATRGIHAPLSSVAKKAGVGQGSLYRHFPTRSSLAVAVFEENADQLELLAADDATSLGDILRAITEQAIASTALFYLDRPTARRPKSPTADDMEVHIGTAPVPDLGTTPPRV